MHIHLPPTPAPPDIPFFQEIDSQYGPVSYLVNAAGISTDALLIKSSPDIIHHTITTNLTSTLLLTQGLIKGMMRISSSSSASKEDPLPSILNISSVTAVKGSPGQSIYSASKAGLLGFTRSLAAELVSRRIRVNAICVINNM